MLCGTGVAATYTVRINGVNEFSATGNLGLNNTATVRPGKVTNRNGQSISYLYKNFAIKDNAFVATDAICNILLVISNGTYTAFTGSYADVDEVPNDGDTTYALSTGVTGDSSTYNLQTAAQAGFSISSVYGLKATFVRKRDGASNGATRGRLRSASTDSDNAVNLSIAGAYLSMGSVFETDPATGGAWAAALSGIQIGLVERSANLTRLSTAYAAVLYSPSVGGLLLRRRREILR